MPDWLGAAIALVFGTVVGSFLNVCVWRLPRDESLVQPGSHCPKCNTPLKSRDLVPLLSFLAQRCRCRYCGTPISWRYFTIELLTGAYFVFTYHFFGWSIDTVAYALFGAALIAIFFIDLEHEIIPDQLSFFGIGLGVAYDIFGMVQRTDNPFRMPYQIPLPGAHSIPIPQSVVGILACGAAFFAIAAISYFIFKKDAMGGGDIKLAAAIGALVGWKMAMVSFFLAVFLGSVIGVALILANRKKRGEYIPFGPFMVVGAFVVMFYFDQLRYLWGLYLNYVGV